MIYAHLKICLGQEMTGKFFFSRRMNKLHFNAENAGLQQILLH